MLYKNIPKLMYRMRVSIVSIVLLFGIISVLFSQNNAPQLQISANDVRIEDSPEEGGLLIYLRAKPGIGSVMLTESAENPDQIDINTFAFRTSEYNQYNSDEQRILNGQFIQLKDSYFIVDSTPMFDASFIQDAFVLFLPYQVSYGYTNTRNGTINFKTQTSSINIRAFAKPYADYTGEYADNSFFVKKLDLKENPPKVPIVGISPQPQMVTIPEPQKEIDIPIQEKEVVEEVEVVVEDTPIQEETVQATLQPKKKQDFDDLLLFQDLSHYSDETINAFTEIANKSSTKPIFIEKSKDIPSTIVTILKNLDPKSTVDVVILLDTTRSMWDDIVSIKSSLIPLLQSMLKNRVFRIGLVYYKDKGEEYEFQSFDFTDQLPTLQSYLVQIQTTGGGDWPESVHEAMQEAVNNFTWLADEKIIFLVGDAPPHESPRDGLNIDKIFYNMAEKKIKIYPFIVPVR